MKLTRRTVVAAVFATVALSLTACGGGSQPGGGAAPSGGFSVWTLTGGSETAFRSSFDQWNKANPKQQVNAEYFANDAYKEKVRTAVGSGNAPTLIYSWAGGTLKDYVSSNKVVDLTSSTAQLQQRLIPAIVDAGKVNGKVYAVPNNNTQPVVLYYNKEVLAKAGISAPPPTFDELLTDVAKLKAAGISTPIALAGQSQWPELMWIEYLADRVGGPQTFQDVIDGKPDAWSSPAMLKALGMIQQLVKAGAFGDKFGSVVADANADAALVHTGKAGMLLQGAWVYSTFLTDAPDFVKAGKLGWGAFPAVTGGAGDPKNVAGNPANFWSISANATKSQQDAALKYLNEAMFNDSYVDELIKGGNVPVTSNAKDKLATSDQAPFLTAVYDMVQQAPHFQLSWDQALSSGQAQSLLNNLSQVFLGQQSPEQFAAAMKASK
jgi:raffinose/stachyose/melibiose transport system substrate-binding protein